MAIRKRLLHEEADSSLEWVGMIGFSEPDVDDSMDDYDYEEVIVNADNFETAYKYVAQYINQQKLDPDADKKWADAIILSVQLR